MIDKRLTESIIGAAINVHRNLGPGLLESAYQTCLEYDLKLQGFKVEKEKVLPITYKEMQLDHGYRIDLLIEDQIVIELKTVDSFHEVHFAQILTYLKLGNYPIGLLINFHSKVLKDGLRRFVNTPP